MSNFTYLSQVSQLLTEISRASAIQSPWAILLVQFNDQKEDWPPMTKYQELFTTAGNSKMNMVRYFDLISHGKIDISGSKVFGPFTLNARRTDYGVTIDRNGLLNLAKTTATSAGVDLTQFAGVCVSCLGQVDLCGWVGGMAALCDTLSLEPSVLGQEMGHGYGLDHARLDGSDADYQDPWDVMSTWDSAYMLDNPDFTLVGPAMNAWNMRARGWLDETRVWTSYGVTGGSVIKLRPLHRRDLSGFLAAQIGEYLVEFRVPQSWDAAIPRACVLIHRFESNHSYLMPAVGGSRDIVQGDKFSRFTLTNTITVEVVDIDMETLTATINLQEQIHKVPSLVGRVLGGAEVDGDGIMIIGHRIIKIPPLGPVRNMVEAISRYLEIDTTGNNVEARVSLQRSALEDIVSHVATLYADTDNVSEQPPGYFERMDKMNNKSH